MTDREAGDYSRTGRPVNGPSSDPRAAPRARSFSVIASLQTPSAPCGQLLFMRYDSIFA